MLEFIAILFPIGLIILGTYMHYTASRGCADDLSWIDQDRNVDLACLGGGFISGGIFILMNTVYLLLG